MLRAIITIWPLFLGIALIQSGNGLQASLLGVRASLEDFGTFTTGIVISGYYWGFLIGSQLGPRLVQQVGHVRVFGAFSAIASSTILMHSLFPDPILWFFMRVLTGLSFSGIYLVAESWLNNASDNKNRGQILSIYMIVQMGSLIVGQLLLGISNPMKFDLFLLTSIIISVAAAPILITAAKVPDFEVLESMPLKKMYSVSPLAVVAIIIYGIANAMFFGMFSVWTTQSGIDNQLTGILFGCWTFGAVIFQWPIGKLSDIFDRRLIITVTAFFSCSFVILAGIISPSNLFWFIVFIILYGGTCNPMYSLCVSYANDFLTPKQMTSAAGTLIFACGLGMIVGPPIASVSIQIFGLNGFLPVMGVIHFSLGIYALWRMTRRPAIPQEGQGPFISVPIKNTPISVSLSPEIEINEENENNK